MLAYLQTRVKGRPGQFPRYFFENILDALHLYEDTFYISKSLYRDMIWALKEIPMPPIVKLEGIAIIKAYETVHYFKKSDLLFAIHFAAEKAEGKYNRYIYRVSKII